MFNIHLVFLFNKLLKLYEKGSNQRSLFGSNINVVLHFTQLGGTSHSVGVVCFVTIFVTVYYWLISHKCQRAFVTMHCRSYVVVVCTCCSCELCLMSRPSVHTHRTPPPLEGAKIM